MMWCLWCAEELKFIPGKGWLHPKGAPYKHLFGQIGAVDIDHHPMPTEDEAIAKWFVAEREEREYND